MAWCVDSPRQWETYIDVEMWRHPDHVVIVSWDTDHPGQPWGMVRTSRGGGEFNDGRYLPPQVVGQLVALVGKAHPQVVGQLVALVGKAHPEVCDHPESRV
jgi:hypothetical protein